MDLNPIAMFSGRAMLRFIDEQLSQDQQLEATSTLAEWMKMRPKGSTPEAVEEFILAWTGAYARLYQMGQAPAQPMVKTLFIEKVESSALFAQADFAVWRRIPSTDPSSTAEAFIRLLLSRCKMIRQEAQYKEKDRNISRAFVANHSKKKERKWKKTVYMSVPEEEDDVSGEWQEDQDEEWYEDGEEYADDEYAANVATYTKGRYGGKGKKGGKGKGSRAPRNKGGTSPQKTFASGSGEKGNRNLACFKFQKEICAEGDACKYAHVRTETRPSKGKGKGFGKSPCRYFQKGECRNGSKCTYSHTAAVALAEDWQTFEPEPVPSMANVSTAILLPTLVCTATESEHEIKWVVDSGAGIHLVPRAHKTGSYLAAPIVIMTANGTVQTSEMTEVRCPVLGGTVQAYVLAQSPYVLSLGRLQHKGFECRWTKNRDPVLVRPDGRSVNLEVQTAVPMLRQVLCAIPESLGHLEGMFREGEAKAKNPRVVEAYPAHKSEEVLPAEVFEEHPTSEGEEMTPEIAPVKSRGHRGRRAGGRSHIARAQSHART